MDDLVPHSGSMSLLDSVVSATDECLIASVLITKDAMFFEPLRGVPAFVGVEYMGQAIAAFAGVKARKLGEPVKIGFLVSSRKYQSNVDYFPLQAALKVTVQNLGDPINGLQIFECLIEGEDITVSANLNVFMPDDASAFLEGAING